MALRGPRFYRGYHLLPHGWLNRAAALAMQSRLPPPLLRTLIERWIRRAGIIRADFEEREHRTLEEFFLRRLRPGARPLGEGITSAVDGVVISAGQIEADTVLQVKSERLSIRRILEGSASSEGPVHALVGGRYLVVFLTPDGYHYVHAPCSGTLLDVRHVPGRWFPQNPIALEHRRGVYEKNDRAVLRFDSGGQERFLVMVGASLIGGIELAGLDRARWVSRGVTPIGRAVVMGEELGHFRFGSTVILLLPPGAASACRVAEGDLVRMGQGVFAGAG